MALAALLGTAPQAGAAPLDAEADAARTEQVILDIASFTRWPQPRPELHLCVVGPPTGSGAFPAATLAPGGIPVHARPMSLADPQLGTECDIVYEGALTTEQRESLIRSLAGHPVLTVGEAMPGCTQTTMFCLERARSGISAAPAADHRLPFSSNLDAIARSGVRLNPRVLLLGRSTPATPQ